MKRWITGLLCMLLLLTGCGKIGETQANIEGALPEIMAKVLVGTQEEVKVMETEVDSTNFQSYFFIEPIEGATGLASEAFMSAIPHTIQLLRLPKDTAVEEVRGNIEKNLNPRKWICVEAEKTAVVAHGDLILVAMSTKDVVDQVVSNFNALAK